MAKKAEKSIGLRATADKYRSTKAHTDIDKTSGLLDLRTVTDADEVKVACNYVGVQAWYDGQLTLTILARQIAGMVNGSELNQDIEYGEAVNKKGKTVLINSITINVRKANDDMGTEGLYYGDDECERQKVEDTFWDLVEHIDSLSAKRHDLFEKTPHELFDTIEWRPAGKDGASKRLPIILNLSARQETSKRTGEQYTLWTLNGYEDA